MDLTHLLKEKAHTPCKTGNTGDAQQNLRWIYPLAQKCPHQEPTLVDSRDGPGTQPASSDGLLWSSVGKQAKGKRCTSKASDAWGVTAPSQNQQMSLGQTRRGSAQQLTLTLALTWGVAASSEKSNDPTVDEPDGWELTERAQQGLLVNEHIKVT